MALVVRDPLYALRCESPADSAPVEERAVAAHRARAGRWAEDPVWAALLDERPEAQGERLRRIRRLGTGGELRIGEAEAVAWLLEHPDPSVAGLVWRTMWADRQLGRMVGRGARARSEDASDPQLWRQLGARTRAEGPRAPATGGLRHGAACALERILTQKDTLEGQGAAQLQQRMQAVSEQLKPHLDLGDWAPHWAEVLRWGRAETRPDVLLQALRVQPETGVALLLDTAPLLGDPSVVRQAVDTLPPEALSPISDNPALTAEGADVLRAVAVLGLVIPDGPHGNRRDHRAPLHWAARVLNTLGARGHGLSEGEWRQIQHLARGRLLPLSMVVERLAGITAVQQDAELWARVWTPEHYDESLRPALQTLCGPPVLRVIADALAHSQTLTGVNAGRADWLHERLAVRVQELRDAQLDGLTARDWQPVLAAPARELREAALAASARTAARARTQGPQPQELPAPGRGRRVGG